ncbi:hypothetical protein RvY_07747 [Ramazzottius varieornatus]|uniref:Uncharacterized protein n=1 Tax=Ramazzottius varieornatus TaxID=947166 RepID=A0A1D1V3C5_RAMVA|nr:hypothetical protein RvY_07747 [Ramazzottius varieornatus]
MKPSCSVRSSEAEGVVETVRKSPKTLEEKCRFLPLRTIKRKAINLLNGLHFIAIALLKPGVSVSLTTCLITIFCCLAIFGFWFFWIFIQEGQHELATGWNENSNSTCGNKKTTLDHQGTLVLLG